MALQPTSRALLGLINPANDADDLLASRNSFIPLVIQKLQTYPEISGVYVDFEGLTTTFTNAYTTFIASLKTALDAANLKLVTALPYDALASADIYYNPTLPTLPFNVLKSYEDILKFTTSGATAFGGAATAVVKDTYCNRNLQLAPSL
uniref:GH18 domain-containing protein n=1 Tax=Anopheles atroparvus TaxID=41427 RepID=A0A182JKV1_ANOAO